MATFAVTYSYSTASAEGRNEHRPRHVKFLDSQFKAGRLLVSGPVGPDEKPGALLVLEGESADDVASLMDHDPFMAEGLIDARDIRPWKIVFGGIERSN